MSQQPANIPLIPPPRQPAVAPSAGGLVGRATQASAATAATAPKPKSQKVCLSLYVMLFTVYVVIQAGRSPGLLGDSLQYLLKLRVVRTTVEMDTVLR